MLRLLALERKRTETKKSPELFSSSSWTTAAKIFGPGLGFGLDLAEALPHFRNRPQILKNGIILRSFFSYAFLFWFITTETPNQEKKMKMQFLETGGKLKLV